MDMIGHSVDNAYAEVLADNHVYEVDDQPTWLRALCLAAYKASGGEL